MFARTAPQRVLRRAAPNSTYTLPRTRNASSESSPTDNDGSTTSTIPEKKHRIIFSGIQPTGVPHLGNYLGALRQWVRLQKSAHPKDKLLFCIVDLHAITTKQDPQQLMQWKREMYASLLAVGLDPQRSHIFVQSRAEHHTDLMWMLSCHASMGYLGRMTQWKSKLGVSTQEAPTNNPALKLGLFSYPVLQAADILLYGATHVPVGEDQQQHLEFAREIAIGFNHIHGDHPQTGNPLLIPPETIISPAKRVMSLTNPTKKMSKSDPDPKSRILITDTREEIHKKIMSARTDSLHGISYDPEMRPGVSNLIDILYYLNEDSASSPEQLANDLSAAHGNLKMLKEKVSHVIDKELQPIREQYKNIIARSDIEMLQSMEPAERYVRSRVGLMYDHLSQLLGLGWHSPQKADTDSWMQA